MKYLNQFLYFDWEGFSKDKRFMAIGKKDWQDFKTKEHLGIKVEAVIFKDNTKYDVGEGELMSNIYEKIIIKVPKDIDIPLNVEIQPVNVEATVYGEYRNQLSIVAEDIAVVKKKES